MGRKKQSRKDELIATGLIDDGEWYWNWASDYRKNEGKTVKIGFLEFTERKVVTNIITTHHKYLSEEMSS